MRAVLVRGLWQLLFLLFSFCRFTNILYWCFGNLCSINSYFLFVWSFRSIRNAWCTRNFWISCWCFWRCSRNIRGGWNNWCFWGIRCAWLYRGYRFIWGGRLWIPTWIILRLGLEDDRDVNWSRVVFDASDLLNGIIA